MGGGGGVHLTPTPSDVRELKIVKLFPKRSVVNLGGGGGGRLGLEYNKILSQYACDVLIS